MTEQDTSRQVAEAARETTWRGAAFLRDLFFGDFRFELLHPYPVEGPPRPKFRAFYDALASFLRTKVDPVAIDEDGEYPDEVLKGLAELGAFGMTIPEEYGGLGFTYREYAHVMMLIGSYDANITALLSAHQSIGVPRPLLLFGSEEQKRRYLPRCARGEISGFALTEPTVGSDPASMQSTANPTDDGEFFILNGTKLWCTNGTIAGLLVVMARTPGKNRISAFIVESDWPGVEVLHRCRFMGLRALANAELAFHDVKIPRKNLIGEEGRGLKIALATLNTGRLSLPAAATGLAKIALETSRKWSLARVQWGSPIGKHEAIAHKLTEMAGVTFAMEAVSDIASEMADRPGYDTRLEAAAAKEWNTVEAWKIVDDALEIRGGRGFETERSLAARGEVPIGIERMLRDCRPNRIFEGSSEIMHLFMAREAVDKHLAVAGRLLDPRATVLQKALTFFRASIFYMGWYLSRWIGWSLWPRYRRLGAFAKHVRFIERSSRRLARSIFHGMLIHRGALERRQGFLFRAVDIAMELFAMAAAVSRGDALRRRSGSDGSESIPTDPSAFAAAEHATHLADVFCRERRRRVSELFRSLWHNDDRSKYAVGRTILEGDAAWLERGIIGLGFEADVLRPDVTDTRSRLSGVSSVSAFPASPEPTRTPAPVSLQPREAT